MSKEKILLVVLLVVCFSAGYIYANSELERRITHLEEENNNLKLELEKLKNYSKISTSYEVYFSPNGGAADRIVYWIDRANKTIYVAIYSFTHDKIGDALVRARERGIDVKVIFEEEQISKYSEYWKIKISEVQVANDTNPYYMHNKFAIIDGYIVLTGSFNWSTSADEKNNENLIIIFDKDLASKYTQEFWRIWNQSKK
ncbi:MAG: phospholipase D family protein [Thermoproteota archaeon]|nr:phospholipase D family protein [Candidatus Brockarchaeota archaeon]